MLPSFPAKCVAPRRDPGLSRGPTSRRRRAAAGLRDRKRYRGGAAPLRSRRRREGAAGGDLLGRAETRNRKPVRSRSGGRHAAGRRRLWGERGNGRWCPRRVAAPQIGGLAEDCLGVQRRLSPGRGRAPRRATRRDALAALRRVGAPPSCGAGRTRPDLHPGRYRVDVGRRHGRHRSRLGARRGRSRPCDGSGRGAATGRVSEAAGRPVAV